MHYPPSMVMIFWLWVGGALGQAAFASWNGAASRSIRRDYHHRGWPVLVGRLLALALWPAQTLLFLALGRAIQRRVDEMDGAKVYPVRCEVCGLVDEFRVLRGNWLQDTPYWYGFLRNAGITTCSPECAKHWEQHHSTEILK